jgi:hypothetical protein
MLLICGEVRLKLPKQKKKAFKKEYTRKSSAGVQK